MYKFAKFNEVMLSEISAEGWLRKWLETQKKGLTGNLDEMCFPFDTKAWGTKKKIKSQRGEDWWPYEPTAYLVESMLKAGYELSDKELIEKAEKQIRFVIDNPDKDGYLGPQALKVAPEGKKNRRWPHAVFFKAMAAYYSATGDKKVLKALTKHYLSNTCPHNEKRDVINVETMLWLYSKTGDKRILKTAVKAYTEYNKIDSSADTSLKSMNSSKKATCHGVTFNEISKIAAIAYLATGEKSYLKAVKNTYKKVDKYDMLVDGVHSSSENLNGNDDILESHETCDVSDFTWATGYLLMATGEAEYADKIERACFNGGFGAIEKDFTSLQYFSCPNQIVSDGSSNHNIFYKGGDWMAFRPTFITQCCAGNVNRFMPNYVARMWMRDKDNGIVSTLFGPGKITTEVGKADRKVTIVQETNYPFSELVNYQIRTQPDSGVDKKDTPVEFSFTVRIPGWCKNAKILVNDMPLKQKTIAGTFVTIKRKFNHNDRITVVLPMQAKCVKWKNGMVVERGPLLYALPINEKRKPAKTAEGLKAWDRYPDSQWNYALDIKDPSTDVEVIFNQESYQKWSIDNPPVEIRVAARPVKGWKMIRCKKTEYEELDLQKFLNEKVLEVIRRPIKGDFHFTPPLPEKISGKDLGKRQMIRLVPYGATTLRMTIFPYVK